MTNSEHIYELMKQFVAENNRPVKHKDLLDMNVSAWHIDRAILVLKKQGKIKVREDKKGYVIL